MAEIRSKDDRFSAFRNSSISLGALAIIEDNRFLVVTQDYIRGCRFALFTVTNAMAMAMDQEANELKDQRTNGLKMRKL